MTANIFYEEIETSISLFREKGQVREAVELNNALQTIRNLVSFSQLMPSDEEKGVFVCYKECGNTQPSGGSDNICLNCGSSIKQSLPHPEPSINQLLLEAEKVMIDTLDLLNKGPEPKTVSDGYCSNPITNEDYCDVLARKKTCKGCKYFEQSLQPKEENEKNPYLLSGDELKRTEEQRKTIK